MEEQDVAGIKLNYENKKFTKIHKKKPNGTPKKVLNINLAKKYGWKAKVTLEDGIGFAINDFIEKYIQKKVK